MPFIAYKKPPRAGPKIAPVCHTVLFQVAAFEYNSFGISCERNANIEGPINALNIPEKNIIPYMGNTP